MTSASRGAAVRDRRARSWHFESLARASPVPAVDAGKDASSPGSSWRAEPGAGPAPGDGPRCR